MNLFDMEALSWCLRETSHVEMQCLIMKLSGRSAQKPSSPIPEKAAYLFTLAEAFTKANNLQGATKALANAKHQYERPLVDASAACEIFHRLFVDIIDDLKTKQFLRVDADMAGFVDTNHLFGGDVSVAFPSATKDIREAGNCLAAECTTAAVFHLMRAAEVALRAVAVDRNISFAKKPLDQQEWGSILIALDTELKERVGESRSLWLKPEFREAQTRFYAEMINELRGFNEAWRKHVAHAGLDAFCDREYAQSVMTHVRNFMQKAASRISETKTMPKYWDAE